MDALETMSINWWSWPRSHFPWELYLPEEKLKNYTLSSKLFYFSPWGQWSVVFWHGNGLFFCTEQWLQSLLCVITLRPNTGKKLPSWQTFIYEGSPSALPFVPITEHTLLSSKSVFKVWKPHLSFESLMQSCHLPRQLLNHGLKK